MESIKNKTATLLLKNKKMRKLKVEKLILLIGKIPL